MEYFKKYYSNTLAGSGNRWPSLPRNVKRTVRAFYRITEGGEREYSLLFTNINDSTYDAGAEGYKNRVYGEWVMHSLKVAVCPSNIFPEGLTLEDPLDTSKIGSFVTLTFGGSETKHVAPGEFFCTDPVILAPEKGDELCVEMVFEGDEIPSYDEFISPIYELKDGTWKSATRTPVPSMIGAVLDKKPRVAFIGDSITCGCATPPDSYTHWCALVAEKLGDRYAYYNLGLGYGRAEDFATGGAWFYKSRESDAAVVCFGVNDLVQGRTEAELKADIETVVDRLHAEGIKVLLQTVPPCNLEGEAAIAWENVNRFIMTDLAEKADAVFDNVPILRESPEKPCATRYDVHPTPEGCVAWAEAISPVIEKFLEAI